MKILATLALVATALTLSSCANGKCLLGKKKGTSECCTKKSSAECCSKTTKKPAAGACCKH